MALQLHVRSLGGHIASLAADPSWTALMVKQELERIVAAPAMEILLFAETQELRNTDVLGAFRETAPGTMELSWVQATATRWPAFALEEDLVREAEEGAARFVSFVPWNNGYMEPQQGMMAPNGKIEYGAGHGAGAMGGFSSPGAGQMAAAHFGQASGLAGLGGSEVSPDASQAGTPYNAQAGWGAVQAGPPDYGWAGAASGNTANAGAAMLGAVPGSALPQQAALAGLPPAGSVAGMPGAAQSVAPTPALSQLPPPPAAPAMSPTPLPGTPLHNLWTSTNEDLSKPAAASPPPAAAEVRTPSPAAAAASGDRQQGQVSPVAAAPAEAPLTSPTTAAAVSASVTGTTADSVEPSSAASGASEGPPPALPDSATDAAQQPSLASPTTPASGTRSPAASQADAASSWNSDYVNPNRTWANIVTKDLQEAAAAGRQASSSSGAPASSRQQDDARSRKDSIIDYLLLLSRCKADALDGRANGNTPELPDDMRKIKQAMEAGVTTNGRAKYNRRGMKNDANNCYVNVVIQSLLPCSALMQLLSHCANGDADRPFYTGMVRLCKEFHSRKADFHGEALNVLNLPQVKKIISTWQQLGAQQDAGEFLFHLLNGLHEECKWKTIPEEGLSTSDSNCDMAGDDGNAAQTAQDGGEARPDVRSSGEHEDSPIFRIFGGIIRSSVQEKTKKADSVSLEPFNGLILDISSSSVDSVWSALEAYCGTEAVNEGQATKRLQFKTVPKVMTLNLKRFSYNKDTGCSQKIRKPVKFEEKITFDSSWLVDELEPQEYQLTAVICHHGDLITGGHYNAAVRYNSDWYMYDDVSVRQIDIREVLSLAASVYLLLYQCNDRIDIRP